MLQGKGLKQDSLHILAIHCTSFCRLRETQSTVRNTQRSLSVLKGHFDVFAGVK